MQRVLCACAAALRLLAGGWGLGAGSGGRGAGGGVGTEVVGHHCAFVRKCLAEVTVCTGGFI